MFPYHYGSYATICSKWLVWSYCSFHTTMVLTQRKLVPVTSLVLYEVSIPLWFLRNLVYGSILMILSQVSIPLWFLRNRNIAIMAASYSVKFPYHYGSYATNGSSTVFCIEPAVSIPLWFLRNCSRN